MVNLLIFALIFIPLAILIGIAAASISFTAWNLIVPLVFIGFGFPIYDALFLSIFVDLVDASILTIIYGKNGKINFRETMIFIIPIFLGATLAFFLGKDLLLNNTQLLRGGVSYVIFLLGGNFIIKGWKGLKKIQESKTSTTQNDEKTINTNSKSALHQQFSPIILNIIIWIAMGISAAMSGILGIGSGMNFVIIFLLFFPTYDLQRATATGAFLMFILMIICSILFFPLVHIDILIPFLLIAGTFSAIGTILASRYALRLSKEKLNIAVGIVMIIAAIVATTISLSL